MFVKNSVDGTVLEETNNVALAELELHIE